MTCFRSRVLQVLAIWCLAAINLAPAQDSAPKGEILEYSFDDSKIFPGTTRKVWVYVPAQYKDDTPACLYVNQDGIQYKAPEVFDELIHKKEMPITIGVFLTPGVVAATSENALDRFNRSFEYDGLGDAYARFLLEEILPDVESRQTTDGRAIVISKEANDRAIGGASSGAICAFTAAWERPDAFSRVFSAIGTYVGLRGGHSYSTLVRKYEPKPLRIYLEDGSNDLNIWGGDWWISNQAMERSLTFAGYEVTHNWGEGGHSGEHATQLFPDAMRWLWKDWPAPIKTGLGSPQLQEILIPGEDWKQVPGEYEKVEGLAVNDKGEVFFNEAKGNRIVRISVDGSAQDFALNSKRGDGHAFGPDGRLFSAATSTSQIVAWDSAGKPTVVTDGFRANDLVVKFDGMIYATSPNLSGPEVSKIWLIGLRGEKKTVDMGLRFANGICLTPDQSLLLVGDYRSHWVYSFQVQEDGSLAHKQKYCHLHAPDTADDSGPDGIRCDQDGRIWVATRMGLQICDQPGRVTCIIPTPNGKVSNLTFGGEKFDTLYCTCGDRVYSRKVKVRGANAWEAPVKPAKPRL